MFVAGFFASLLVVDAKADCPPTDCSGDCGSSGSGCAITQYDENGNLCSWTICYGRRGNIE